MRTEPDIDEVKRCEHREWISDPHSQAERRCTDCNLKMSAAEFELFCRLCSIEHKLKAIHERTR